MYTSETFCDLSVADRVAAGRDARSAYPRQSIGEYSLYQGRLDPVDVLTAQESERVSELLPLRHTRMSQSPFAFLRGAAAVMAADQAQVGSSGLLVQACGDAHLSNFGIFAAPDRGLVFDVNDFDETHTAPFEWDVQRLAASFLVAAKGVGIKGERTRVMASLVGAAYREAMAKFATMSELDLWYFRVDTARLAKWADQDTNRRRGKQGKKVLARTEHEALGRDRWSAVRKLTEMRGGTRRFLDQPPLLVSFGTDQGATEVAMDMFTRYRQSLLVDRAELLSRYTPVDNGHKVVGVGSVGLLAFVMLLQGRDADDLLVLQFKEAVESVLAPFTTSTAVQTPGERVVDGQRLMQAATDAFLGAVQGPSGRSYYVRQLRDMKWSPDPTRLSEKDFMAYAKLCGLALARAHARSGDAIAISSYLGKSTAFDQAIAEFARKYARQTQLDYAEFTAAISNGTITTETQPTRSIPIQLSKDS